MKFIFTESFNLCWNGFTARNDKGISGSHTVPMYLAEGLAQKEEMDVTIVNLTVSKEKKGGRFRYLRQYANNIIEGKHLNVNYVNYSNLPRTTCDYIITTNWTDDLTILHKVIEYKKLIIIMHNNIYAAASEIKSMDKSKVIIAYISKVSKENILNSEDSFLKDFDSIILNNSIDTNDIKPVVEKEKSFVYFPCIERGYKMVLEVIKHFPDFKLYTNMYLDDNRELINPNEQIVLTENSSKNTIYQYCAKSKYFVYPLINLETDRIHYDTFGYVILEALVHGVVVIAPKMAVYEELFGDAVCYIDTDDIIPNDDLIHWNKWNKNFGLPIINRYVEKIKLLEDNVELYNEYVKRGFALKEKYSNIKIANNLLDMLN
jgi:glycosyltransferase involved in cell wall biosynthesis